MASTVALAGVLALTAHCGDGGDTTGRVRVTFPVTVQGIGAESDNSFGWHVRVEGAWVALGPVRWYEGAPIFGLNLFERAMGVRLAHAHPGHYVPGEALADITQVRVVDLLSPTPTALGDATGVSGECLSARVELRPPDASLGPAAAPLHGLAVWARGAATKNGVTVRFEGGVPVDYAVRGVPARATFGAAGGFAVTVDLAQWFDRADFSTIRASGDGDGGAVTGDASAATGDGGVKPITMTSEVANGLYRGVTNGAAYGFAWRSSDRDS